MTLRRRTQITMGILLILLLVLLDATFSGILLRTAEQTDIERMHQKLSQVAVSLSGEAETLSAITGNWAFSDLTWDYMHGKNPNYAQATLNKPVLTKIGISSMMFINSDNTIRFFKDYSSAEDPSSPASEFSAISSDPKNKNIFSKIGVDGANGIALRGKEPILFSIKPILTSKMEGSPAGYLIVTRTISSILINNISKKLYFDFAIEPVTSEDIQKSATLPESEVTSEKKSTIIAGRRLMRDGRKEPVLWITASAEKTNIAELALKLQMLFAVFALIAFLFCLFFDWKFKNNFSRRMKLLKHETEDLRDGIELSNGVLVDRKNDEITEIQRILNDVVSFSALRQQKAKQVQESVIEVYKRFADTGTKMCYKTLEEIAVSFSPCDSDFQNSILREAEMTSRLCKKAGIDDDECHYAYLGALFSRIGLHGVPFAIRKSDPDKMSWQDKRVYQRYPIISKDILMSVTILRPAAQLPFCWNENWDGTGFPTGMKGVDIPIIARMFAAVDVWNEMTRPWTGRVMPTQDSVEARLRSLAGTRLDPQAVDLLIQILEEDEKKQKTYRKNKSANA